MSKKTPALWAKTIVAGACAAALATIGQLDAQAAEPKAFAIAQAPLFVSAPLPNVLFLLDNSNSFDERPDGVPVGSNHNASKSIIARSALRSIVDTYQGQMNLGLMTYKLGSYGAYNVSPTMYDASFEPSSYDAGFTRELAAANNWEAFPYASWASSSYGGTYSAPRPCAAPFSCPWPAGIGSPYNYAGLSWSDGALSGERRGNKAQYANLNDLRPWGQHPFDFIYYNVIQAGYSSDLKGYKPPGGSSAPPPPLYCFSNNTLGLHGLAPNAPAGIGGNNYNCRWTKAPPQPNYQADGIHNAKGLITSPTSGSNEARYGFSNSAYSLAYVATDSDQAQGFTSFGRIIVDMGNSLSSTDIPAAPSYYQSGVGSNGGGSLRAPIAPLSSAQLTKINGLLQCNIPSTWAGGYAYAPPPNTTACAGTGIVNAGATPSPGALQSALRYFSGKLLDSDNGTGLPLPSLNTQGSGANNMPDSCGNNFVIFFTDGMPTHKPDGSMYSSPEAAIADTVSAAKALKDAGTLVYVIGFGNAVQQSGLDQIAKAGGTTTSYVSSDEASLNAALSAVFNDVIVRSASSASVATNSAQFSAETSIFQARFTSSDWSGQLLRFQTDNATGAVDSHADWDSGQVLNAQPWQPGSASAGRRQIVAGSRPGPGDSAGGTIGAAFSWPSNPRAPAAGELRAWQAAALNTSALNVADSLGAARLSWTRGDRSSEGTLSTQMRRRVSVLGDIANSYPLFVGPPASATASGSAYYDFRKSYAARKPVVAAGANDGMMHIFDAATGSELFAYIPSSVFRSNAGASGAPRISQPMRQDYKANHVYMVDGSPASEDAMYGGAWHTVLAAGVGGGGQAVFALNITNTANDSSKPDPALTEANASRVLLWEFADKNMEAGTLGANGDPSGIVNGDPDMGYAFSKPIIALAANNKWVAIFGNGYNNTFPDGSASSTGRAALYVVDIQTGALIKKISIPAGTASIPNGLGSPRGLDSNLDGKIDSAYAGDLYGNLWKFDLSSASPSAWGIAYSGAPLFTINDVGSTSNRRPITGEIRVTPSPSGGYVLLFGSGRYLATPATDTPSSYDSNSLDALYSVWDSGRPVANGRAWLRGQELRKATSLGGSTYRQLTNNATTTCSYGNTPSTQPGCTLGCYVDLKDYPAAGLNGERFTFFPQLRSGSASFNTIIPSGNACSAGGNTEQVIFNYLTCSADSFSPFDTNGDDRFTSSDLVPFDGSADQSSAAGSKILTGITPPGTRVYNSASGQIYVYNSSSLGGTPTQDKLRFNGRGGRVSWRPLAPTPQR